MLLQKLCTNKCLFDQWLKHNCMKTALVWHWTLGTPVGAMDIWTPGGTSHIIGDTRGRWTLWTLDGGDCNLGVIGHHKDIILGRGVRGVNCLWVYSSGIYWHFFILLIEVLFSLLFLKGVPLLKIYISTKGGITPWVGASYIANTSAGAMNNYMPLLRSGASDLNL